jgi:hypothetical protein
VIKHVVFFKFKPGAAAADRKAALDRLRRLPDKIDVIRRFEVGDNVLPSARAWDAVLIGDYDDLAALDIYTRHDEHVKAAMGLKDLCEAVGSVDYEF